MPVRPVSEVIKDKAFIVAPAALPVREAARLMKEHHIGAVLVVDDEALIGICTERDIVFEVVVPGLDPDATPVSAVMSDDPQTISPDRPFGHALHLMFEGGYRHVPVVDGQRRPVGLVSARDALGLDVLQFEKELLLREGMAEIL